MSYIWVEAWGRMLGSSDYYIRDQQALAETDEAPDLAVYKNQDGVWVTLNEVTSMNTLRDLRDWADRKHIDWPL